MATRKNAPVRNDIGPKTRHLLGYGELQKALYLSRTQTFRLEREGARLLPDVIITPDTMGWEPARVLRYGVDVGRLAEDGQPAGGWDGDRPRNRVPDGSLPHMRRLVEEKYSAPPKVYLGSAHCSFVYGLGELSVFFLRHRGTFFPASVKVGSKFLGWDEEEVIKFGRQTGRLVDPEILRTWAVRRTVEFKLDPRAPWVVKLLGEDNLPAYEPLPGMPQAVAPVKEGNTPA